MRDFKQCANHSRCVNEQQGSLTEQDYPPATRGIGLSVICHKCVERKKLARQHQKGSQGAVFGGMTRYEVFNSRWDVYAAQAFLVGMGR